MRVARLSMMLVTGPLLDSRDACDAALIDEGVEVQAIALALFAFIWIKLICDHMVVVLFWLADHRLEVAVLVPVRCEVAIGGLSVSDLRLKVNV